MIWMLRNSGGKKDSMLTFACVGLLVTAVTVVLSAINKISVGGAEIVLKTPDIALVTIFLGATITAYVARKNLKEKHAHDLAMKQLELSEKE